MYGTDRVQKLICGAGQNRKTRQIICNTKPAEMCSDVKDNDSAPVRDFKIETDDLKVL